MDSVKIRFCDSNGYLIQNARSKSDIIQTLIDRYNLDIFNMYEKSYSDRLIDVIKTKPFYSCLITRGKPYILYLTKIYNQNVSLLIDLKSKNNMIPKITVVPLLSIDSEFFKDTVFYGEMLNHTGTWVFMIESCKVYRGKSMHKKQPLDNIKLCYNFVANEYKYNFVSPFKIISKKFSDLCSLDNLINEAQYDTIGVKFIGLSNPIVFLFNTRNYADRECSKIKLFDKYSYSHIEQERKQLIEEFSNETFNNDPSMEEYVESSLKNKSFTFIIQPSNNYGLFELYNENNNFGIARIVLLETNNQLFKIFRDKKFCYVKASYNYKFNKWEVLDIVDSMTNDSKSIIEHISKFENIKKPLYLQQNC